MGRPANSFSVPREQMIRHMIKKRQLQEGLPNPFGPPAGPTQSTKDFAAQMPTTPSTLGVMSQMEFDRGFGNMQDGLDAGMAAMHENDQRNREPSMNMLPARAAQTREYEQFMKELDARR